MPDEQVSGANSRARRVIDDVCIESHMLEAHCEPSHRKLHASHAIEVNRFGPEYLSNEPLDLLGIHRVEDLPVFLQNGGDKGPVIHRRL
ncbi:MAG: hypothetical protein WCC08_22295, partial [Terrimicrobiaceae bacterium]